MPHFPAHFSSGFLILLVVILCVYGVYHQFSFDLGTYGENLIVKKLKQLKDRQAKILRNLYLPKNRNGDTTEIDIVLIRSSGIYVIESKNYSGEIFGDGNSDTWTQYLGSSRNLKQYDFFNPVFQNNLHVRCLKEFARLKNVPVYSIIVFSERCELKYTNVNQKNTYVIKLPALTALMKKLHNRSKDALSRKQINQLYQKLLPQTHVSRTVKKQHIENIRKNKDQRAS